MTAGTVRDKTVNSLTSSERQRLTALPLIARLPPGSRDAVMRSVRLRTYTNGKLIVREGDLADAFFVLLSGEAHVTAHLGERNVTLGTLTPGAFFGEQALLYESSGRRTASVQALSAVRCAWVHADIFRSSIASHDENRRTFNTLSLEYLRRDLEHSIHALRGLVLSESAGANVRRQSFGAGDRIITSGDAADAVFFVLDGIALGLREQDDSMVECARIGPGQCFGELGVMRHRPRSASVVAETALRVVRIEAQTFRDWYDEQPGLRDFLGALEHVYPVSGGRRLSVYRGAFDGRPSISTICGDPSGDCVVSTKVLGEDVVVFTRGGTPTTQEIVRHEDDGAGRLRELRLMDVRRAPSGQIEEARIAGVVARRVGPDLGHLYRKVLDQTPIDSLALKRFRRSGYLGGATSLHEGQRLCSCMRLGRDDVLAIAAEHGNNAQAVSVAIGIGQICGACIPDVEALLAQPPGRAEQSPPTRVSSGNDQHVTGLIVRRPSIDFAPEILLELSGEPEFHLMAVASVFATTGERFMIRSVSAAMASVSDPALLADTEAFLAQESNHVTVHEPFNALLLERIFPESRALRRLTRRLVSDDSRVSLRFALAVCAAFEYTADCVFAIFFERYYALGRYHPDPAVHERVLRSGVADLFHWHGAEELSHRHVAFDMMAALGATYWTRVVGFVLYAVLGMWLLLPAVVSVRRCARGRRRINATGEHVAGMDVIPRTIWRSLKFLRPGFHPQDTRYPFLSQLARDAERFPVV